MPGSFKTIGHILRAAGEIPRLRPPGASQASGDIDVAAIGIDSVVLPDGIEHVLGGDGHLALDQAKAEQYAGKNGSCFYKISPVAFKIHFRRSHKSRGSHDSGKGF